MGRKNINVKVSPKGYRKKRRRSLSIASAIIVLLLIIFIILPEFISPYSYCLRYGETEYRFAPRYSPPMIGRLHFWGETGFTLRPFVCAIGEDGEEDCSRQYPIYFFIHGDRYRLWGIFETNLHLFGTGEPSDSPGQIFLLGTDEGGEDLLTKILLGGRTTLSISFIVVFINFLLGIILGSLSGYYGRWIDDIIQRVTEIFMSIPRLALLISLTFIANFYFKGTTINYWIIVGVLSFVNWAPLAREIRGQVLAVREEEYVMAAKALGATAGHIIINHILRNISGFLIVSATLSIPNIIILESVLSFIGWGIQEPLMSWGSLLQAANRPVVITNYPWLLIPAFPLFFTIFAFNFLGDALRDALEVRG